MSPKPPDDLILAVIREVQDVSLGSLFWVSDSLWMEVLPSEYFSDRKEHPGVSCGAGGDMGEFGAVVMVYGRSKPPRNLAMLACTSRGLSPSRPPPHTTYFGRFGPVWLEGVEFICGSPHPPRVRRNWYKRRLSLTEIAQLDAWFNSWSLD